MDYNFELFNAITDALKSLEEIRAILVTAQQTAEEIYISANSHAAGYSAGEKLVEFLQW